MQLKSYFAPTVESAMALASRELGDEAMLVYSRPAAPESEYLGKHEVVFALPPTNCTSGLARDGAAGSQPVDPSRSIQNQLDLLFSQLQALSDHIRAAGHAAAGRSREPGGGAGDFSRAGEGLEGQGNGIGARHEATRPRVLDTASEAIHCERILITGPPGSGKSAAAVKLAAKLKIEFGQHPCLALLLADRIGGGNWLTTAADLLSLPFHLIQPGHGAPGRTAGWPTGRPLIVELPPIECGTERSIKDVEANPAGARSALTLLTLPATWRGVELRHTLRRYEVLNPSGVILTMADLAADCREGLAAIGEFGLPVALVSDGIHVPGSVRFASAEILAALERPSMAPEGSRPAGACQTVAQTGKAAAAA